MYLGTIQICQNLNEHFYYLISTTSVDWQIDANFSPFQSLDMLPFHIRFGTLKTNLIGLTSYFLNITLKRASTVCLLFSSSHVFANLKCNSNHFGILLWKIVKPSDHNEIQPPIRKILQKHETIKHYFVMAQKWLSCSLVTKFTTIIRKHPTSKGVKNALIWKTLLRKKSTFLSKLDLLEAITWQLFESLPLGH